MRPYIAQAPARKDQTFGSIFLRSLICISDMPGTKDIVRVGRKTTFSRATLDEPEINLLSRQQQALQPCLVGYGRNPSYAQPHGQSPHGRFILSGQGIGMGGYPFALCGLVAGHLVEVTRLVHNRPPIELVRRDSSWLAIRTANAGPVDLGGVSRALLHFGVATGAGAAAGRARQWKALRPLPRPKSRGSK